ncbi:MAG TPA: serine hydrolase [Flavipsychrobacter sp.]|nr:serine hydrolase [Flavipsychrobacter sp.]
MNRLLYPLMLCCIFCWNSGKAQLSQSYKARLDFVFDSVCIANNMHGASAAVIVPNQGIWKRAFGVSETGVPLDTNMLIGIGSNTKTYIAVTLLKMQEQSLVNLDDTIGTWIQHPQVNGQITIRQLLNHTSGVFSYTNNPDFEDSILADFNRVWQPEEMFSLISPPVFAPGGGWDYSNSNYLLAGLIIKDMNQPLSTTLRNMLLNPHGLNNTILFPEESSSLVFAHPWSDNFSGTHQEDLIADYGYSNNAVFSMAWAAGALIATAEDNAMFWSKLINGQLLNSASMAELKQWVTLNASTRYGLGIFRMNNVNLRHVLSHGGTNLGYINENLADSVSGVAISVLTNQDSIMNGVLFTRVVAPLHKATIQLATDISDIHHTPPKVTIYPNPSQGKIYISGMPSGKLQLSDINGRQLFSSAFEDKKEITLPHVAPGLYIVRLTDDKGNNIHSTLKIE